MTTLGTGRGKYSLLYQKEFGKLSHEGEEKGIPCDLFRERLTTRKHELGLTNSQIRALAAEADRNQDNKITMEEFEILCASHKSESSALRRAMYSVADAVITPKQRIEVYSYLNEYTCCPPPIFIITISIIQVAIFFYYYEAYPSKHHDITNVCAGCYVDGKVGPLMFVPQLRQEAWRFFSYMFLHAGVVHLAGNIIMQVIVGVPLELVHKVWRIAPLYLLAVAGGSLLQYTIDPRVYLVGASAGVYALILAHLANVFINWSEMPLRYLRIAILGVFLTMDIGGAVYRRYYADVCDKVSHAAHLAGGVTGFCFGVFILYNLVERNWEKVVKWICAGLYALFLVVTIVLAFVRAPHDKPLWEAADCAENQ